MTESPQEILDRILSGLKSDDTTDRLAAIYELNGLDCSSPAIVLELESLAIKGTKPVRQGALDALDSKISQYIRSQSLKHLQQGERLAILAEIEGWEQRGLVQHDQAEVLRRRYDFSRKPIERAKPRIAPAPELIEPFGPRAARQGMPEAEAAPAMAPAGQPARPQLAESAAPSLTLSQRLLSQTSINIALYLGAFLVIGAAAILAALVKEARLPILLAAGVLFAGGSFAIKKRLPQASLTLFVVFSFLLPISATVIAQTLNLSSQSLFSLLIPISGVTVQTFSAATQNSNAYWATALFFMTVIWGLGTWAYSSRWLSVAAFVSFSSAILRFSAIFHTRAEWNILILTAAGLVGLFGVRLIRAWKDRRFALPLFITTQILCGLTLLGSLGSAVYYLFQNATSSFWLATALTWVAVASFYACSALLYSFPPFAWACVAALSPVSWLMLRSFDATLVAQIFGLGVWGSVFALASELSARRPVRQAKDFHPPFLLGSLPLFMAAAGGAFFEHLVNDQPIAYAFGVLLGAAVMYTVLMVLRPRPYIWATALIFGLAAYFTFFLLPFIESENVYAAYQWLGASLLLLTPGLFFKSPLTTREPWRWPAFLLGALVTIMNVVQVTTDQFSATTTGVVMAVYALVFAAYALYLRRPWIGYLATASAAIAPAYLFQNASLNPRLAVITGIAVAYFVGGWFLRAPSTRAWGGMLRLSGLVLGAILSFTVLGLSYTTGDWNLLAGKTSRGWHVLAVSAMFFAEAYIRPEDRIEASGPAFASIAISLILSKFAVTALPIHLLALSLIWLGADLVYSRTLKRRRTAILTRIAGAVLVVGNLPALILYGYRDGQAEQAAIIFGVYVLLFAVAAWVYRAPIIGYASAAALAFAALLTLQHLHRDLWLPVLTGLSLLYWAGGRVLPAEKTRGWGTMLRMSGLALGATVSAAALITLHPGSPWYVLVIGAVFALETYQRREDRLEPSAPIFFSMAAFLGMQNAGIHEIAYYALAISMVWLTADLVYSLTFQRRRFALVTRLVGGASVAAYLLAIKASFPGNQAAAAGFGTYTVFFAIYAWFYRNPRLGYLASASLPLGLFFGLQAMHRSTWLYEIAAVAILYYAAGYVLRRSRNAPGWSRLLINSGLCLGVINSVSAPLRLGLETAIPVALAATLFAIEAFDRRSVWLAFPADALYLESYYLILISLNVGQPQYFSVGAAALGMLMNYLLARAGSKHGAFLMGLASQLVLLGTTYIQMVAQLNLAYFFVLFFQSLIVLAYGILMRSRSLVIAPISFTVLGVLTVVYYALKDLSLVVIIGTTGITLLLLGILAAMMRERIAGLTERFRDWQA